jgi:hypothetical protein
MEISTQTRIQQHEDYWYTVEDTHIDVGCPGCTISYWELPSGMSTIDKRIQHICMEKEEALAVADAIYKFFKKD